MKITKHQLVQIIQEEADALLGEWRRGPTGQIKTGHPWEEYLPLPAGLQGKHPGWEQARQAPGTTVTSDVPEPPAVTSDSKAKRDQALRLDAANFAFARRRHRGEALRAAAEQYERENLEDELRMSTPAGRFLQHNIGPQGQYVPGYKRDEVYEQRVMTKSQLRQLIREKLQETLNE